MTEISSSILRTTGYPIPDALQSGSNYTVTLVSGSGYLTDAELEALTTI